MKTLENKHLGKTAQPPHAADRPANRPLPTSSTLHLPSSALVLPALLAAAVGMALTSPALAQVQQVQQGRVLDANNQVGSGGSNQPVQGYTPINGNDIVSGNVAGLKYFHGNVQTPSPYQFGSTQGSASFNSFIRQSAGNGPGAYSSGLGSVYYNSSSMVSRGPGGFSPGVTGSGYESRYIPSSALSPTVSTGAAPVAAGLPFRAYDRLNAAENSAVIPADAPGGALASPNFSFRSNAAIDSALKSNKVEGTGTGPKENDNIDSKPKTPNEIIAPIPDTVAGSGRISDRVAVAPMQTERSELRVSETYKTLLEELRQVQDAANKAAGLTTGAPGSEAANSAAAGTPANPLSSAGIVGGDNTKLPKLEIDPITGKPRTAITAADRAKTGLQSTNPALPGYISKSALTALESQPDTTLKAGQKVKPVTSLVGPAVSAPTMFGQLMKKAEDQMAKGDYLEAADSYQSALLAQPNDALAILGRGHAELAAGMYESSAGDLKFVFTKKPELISVRFDLAKNLPQERQEYLLKDLGELAQKEPSGNTASFLYCYLSYQTDHNLGLNEESGRWGVRAWKDSWYDITKRAWTK